MMIKTFLLLILLIFDIRETHSLFAQEIFVKKVLTINKLLLSDNRIIKLEGVTALKDFKLNKTGLQFLEGLVKAKPIYLEQDSLSSDKKNNKFYVWYEVFPNSEEVQEKDLPRFYWTQRRVTSDGKSKIFVMLNATIIKAGYAKVFEIFTNPQYSKLFQQLYQEGQDEHLGLCRDK